MQVHPLRCAERNMAFLGLGFFSISELHPTRLSRSLTQPFRAPGSLASHSLCAVPESDVVGPEWFVRACARAIHFIIILHTKLAHCLLEPTTGLPGPPISFPLQNRWRSSLLPCASWRPRCPRVALHPPTPL